MRILRYVLIAIVLALFVPPAAAATWYVHPGGAGDAVTIQGGIDLASSGDIVQVAPGTYTGPGNYNITIADKFLTITSETGAYFTVVDCQSLGRGFSFANADGSILEGFTIKNGFESNGGGVHIDDSAVTVRFNIIRDNTASNTGGGIYARKNSPVIYNNTIDGNSAPSGGGVALRGPISGQVYRNVICNSTQGAGIVCKDVPLVTVVTCNDLWGNAGGNAVCGQDGGDNFSSDPLFCGIPGSGNFFLQETSPCTPTYSPCGLAIGALGVACKVTATENVTWGHVKTLYR
jgi:parallel beta-helix repeat protein